MAVKDFNNLSLLTKKLFTLSQLLKHFVDNSHIITKKIKIILLFKIKKLWAYAIAKNCVKVK